MGPFIFGMLMMHHLLKCYGHTYFYHHPADSMISLSCKGFGWLIDRDFDNQVDCAAEVQRKETHNLEGSGDSQCPKCFEEYEAGRCQIEARSGFYACVHDNSSHSIYPFKHQTNVEDSYVVLAVQDAQLMYEHGHPFPQRVTEGSAIFLNCSFTRDTLPQKRKARSTFSHQPYVLYWLKISVNSSASCISSYSTENKQHCFIDPDIGSRMSKSSSSSSGIGGSSQLLFHNVSIGQSQPSDSGVYVCVLNVQSRALQGPVAERDLQTGKEFKEAEKSWVVIQNITVKVKPNGNQGYLVGLHVATAFFLITLLALILLLAWRKQSSRAHQFQMTPSSRNEEEDNNKTDCSPYAVGFRQAEPYSVVNIRKQIDSARPTPVGPSGLSSDVLEPYSVVQLRSQGDSALSTPAGPSGLSSDVPEPYSVVNIRTQMDSAASTPAGQTSDISDAYSVITFKNSE